MTRAEELTRKLGGQWRGHYGTAPCPSHEDRAPSLSLANGNDGRVLLKCHAGCTYTEISAALEADGLGRSRLRGEGRSDPVRKALQRAKADVESKKRAEQARRLWDATQPIHNTVAETHLRKRGVSCPLPDTLRYVPDCWHPTAKRIPALVCYIAGGQNFAVHRTYLAKNGEGKAQIEPAKAMLGCTKGGAVRLAKGNSRLVVTEGVETALSLASGLLPDNPSIWAAMSTSGMVSLNLPENPGLLTVAADGDQAGRTAAERLALRASDLGWQVSMLNAPEGKDWNDVLLEQDGMP